MTFIDNASVSSIAWAQLSAVSDKDTNYSIGVDFVLKAVEQDPMPALENRPIQALENKIEKP